MIANKFAILLFVVAVAAAAVFVVFIMIIVFIVVAVAVPVLAYRCTAVYHYAIFFLRAILCVFNWIWLFLCVYSILQMSSIFSISFSHKSYC